MNIVSTNGYCIGGFYGRGFDDVYWLKIDPMIELSFSWHWMKGPWDIKGHKILGKWYGHTSIVYDRSIYIFGGVVESGETK